MGFWRRIAWDNVILDLSIVLFFEFAYETIEGQIVAHRASIFWFMEILQLYIFLLMAARFFYDRAHDGGAIDPWSAAAALPKVAYAFIGLGGFWLLFAAFQLNVSERWAVVVLVFAHFFISLWIAVLAVRLARGYLTLHAPPALVHIFTMLQVTAGFIAMEVFFVAMLEGAGTGSAGLAMRITYFFWGLASFLPFRIFLMVQPPFNKIEVLTALVAYVWLFKTAISE